MGRYALCTGLTRVDPQAWDGWDGDCTGCDLDLARIARLCNRRGFDGIWTLLNAAASAAGLEAAFRSVRSILRRGDLLVLYYSGHGGQMPDLDGDELDGLDETLCLWDGQVADDRLGEYFRLIPEGVRVLSISDSCNAGTNFRGGRRGRSSPRTIRPGLEPWIDHLALLHWGGCSDGRSSYGDANGGRFTNALARAYSRKRGPISYRDWFDRAARLMPANQRPVAVRFGEDFGGLEALT